MRILFLSGIFGESAPGEKSRIGQVVIVIEPIEQMNKSYSFILLFTYSTL